MLCPFNWVALAGLPEAFYAAAASFGVVAITAPVHDMSELESVIAALAREPNGGLVVIPEDFTVAHRAEIISLTARYRRDDGMGGSPAENTAEIQRRRCSRTIQLGSFCQNQINDCIYLHTQLARVSFRN
jgi:hypothetical protein